MINKDNKKINAIKLGTNNCKRVYIGNDLVFRQGKWVFYKKKTIYQARYSGHDTILVEHLDYRNGGKFLIMLNEKSYGGVMILSNAKPSFFLDYNKNEKDNAVVLDINKPGYNYTVTIRMGKFDVNRKLFYNSLIYEKDINIGNPYGINGYADYPYGVDIDIYKWQEE